jgi:hypothetical protein
VLLRLENSVSTRTAREGDYVYLRTAVPIAANGQIVVPEGSYVQGVVTHSLRSGRVKGKAELAIRIDTLTLPSGKVIKLSPRLNPSIPKAPSRKSIPTRTRSNRDRATAPMRLAWPNSAAPGAAIGGLATRTWTEPASAPAPAERSAWPPCF